MNMPALKKNSYIMENYEGDWLQWLEEELRKRCETPAEPEVAEELREPVIDRKSVV